MLAAAKYIGAGVACSGLKKLIITLKKQMLRTQMIIQHQSNQLINHFKLNTNIKITQSFFF